MAHSSLNLSVKSDDGSSESKRAECVELAKEKTNPNKNGIFFSLYKEGFPFLTVFL